MRIAWGDDTGYISYLRADIPVLVLFIVETSMIARRSETTYGIQENHQQCCETDGGFNACETSMMHKDIRDLEALTCSDVRLDQQPHDAHYRMTAGGSFPRPPLDQLWDRETKTKQFKTRPRNRDETNVEDRCGHNERV